MTTTQQRITADTLASVSLFAKLNRTARAELAPMFNGWRYAVNSEIVSQNDRSRDVYFLISGRVRVTYFSSKGREVTFRDQEAGTMFGELAAVDGKRRSAQVLTLEESVLAQIAPEHFTAILTAHPSLMSHVLVYFAGLIRSLSERVVDLSTRTAASRVRSELMRLVRDREPSGNAVEIAPAPTHVSLANRVSTQREAVTREINELKRLGIIKTSRGALLVLDIAALENLE